VECVLEEREDVEQINELEAWDDHVDRVHGGIQTLSGDVVENDVRRKRKKLQRKRGSAALIVPTTKSQYRPYRRRSRRISSSLSSRVERNDSETSTLVDEDTSTPGRLTRVSSSSSLSSLSSLSSSIIDCDIVSRIDPRDELKG